MSRFFSVIGDSNIGRHLNKVNCRSNPLMKAAQVLPCGHIEVLPEALQKLRSESNVCILACVTNLFTSIQDASSSTVSHRIDPVLTEFCSIVSKACEDNPELSFLISPPMYRTHPFWYRDGLPEIMTLFSSSLVQDKPQNLHILPSFPTPSFESDGVHLTAYSGLEFVLHLFDSSMELLDSLSLSSDQVSIKVKESTRTLEDRVMVLEQDHRRLSRECELKSAVDAELHDWRMNERWEDFFVLKGLPLLPSTGLSTKEWQERAVRDVQGVLRVLLNREVPIVFVQNATNKQRDTLSTYHVQVSDARLSGEIRLKFSGYFSKGQDLRPTALKKLSLRNRVTQETHVRISIMHLFGQRWTKSNSGSSYKVLGYKPRPVLRLFPSSSAADRRVKNFTFIEAIKMLPTNFSKPELEDLIQKIPYKFVGKLRSLFVVLPDDLARLLKKAPSASGSGDPPLTSAPEQAASESSDDDQESTLDPSVPVPVSAPPSSAHHSRKRPPSPGALTSKKSSKSSKTSKGK